MRINYVKLLLSGYWFKRVGGFTMFYPLFRFRKYRRKVMWSKMGGK